MKNLIIIALAVFAICHLNSPCFASSLETLKSVKLDEFSMGSVNMYYSPNICNLLMKDISRTDYIKELMVAEVRLTKESNTKYLVEYTSGPSEDPGFFIRIADGDKRISTKIDGLNIAFKGDGSFYVWGHVNSYFNIRKQYEIINGRVVESLQPFYYVGLDSQAKKELTIYNNTNNKDAIYNIAIGEKLQIVLKNGEWYLIKTSMGTLGWWKPQNSEFYKSDEINGLFYYGD